MRTRPHGWIKGVELPDTGKVADALLIVLYHFNRPVAPMDVYGIIAERLGLSSLQRAAPRETRDEPAWHNRVQTARIHLVRQGLVDDELNGFWSLTSVGRERARMLENPPQSAKEMGL